MSSAQTPTYSLQPRGHRRQIIAIILALLPFVLFIGTTNVTTINGQTVQDSRFNLAGVILSLVAFSMAAPFLRRGGVTLAGRVLALVAVALSLLQLANAIDLLRIDGDTIKRYFGGLPELTYSGELNEDDLRMVSELSRAGLLRALTFDKTRAEVDFHLHAEYAEKCHSGKLRIDRDRALAEIPEFGPEETQEVDKYVANWLRSNRPLPVCSSEADARYMGEYVDDAHHRMDRIDAIRAAFDQRGG
ncbi:MAG: hypothetical protein Q4G26_03540 [Paracoccus sp. (in: a-proteobacteria)]|nr:hypothetical protein [Paracoccus sp. (in: a-proteobacteria)]